MSGGLVGRHSMTEMFGKAGQLYALHPEQAVIGALMVVNAAWWKIADKLKPEDFYYEPHGKIYAAIGRLAEAQEPFDIFTIEEELKRGGDLDDVGGLPYLIEISMNCPSAANIASYAQTVADYSMRRAMVQLSRGTAQQAREDREASIPDITFDAMQRLIDLQERAQSSSGPRCIDELVGEFIDYQTELQEGGDKDRVRFGLRDLDELLLGIEGEDLLVIAGRPSMGKTALGLHLARHAALEQGKNVLVFSKETAGKKMVARWLASMAGVNARGFKTGKLEEHEWAATTEATTRLVQGKRFFVDDDFGLTPAGLRARAHQLHRRLLVERGEGLGLLIVDHIALLDIPEYKGSREQEIAKISRGLKILAGELGCPIVALAQLNRQVEGRQNKRPTLSDLRDSGAIEQDADIVLMLYRDEYYDSNSQDKGVAEIICAKSRDGATGTVRAHFAEELVRFSDLMQENRLPNGWENSSRDKAPATPATTNSATEGDEDEIWN